MWVYSSCFNSLQTGKRIWTDFIEAGAAAVQLKFQFPSNGKAYLNADCDSRRSHQAYKFQFPSNGKAYLNRNAHDPPEPEEMSFNSLQTGKRIWTDTQFERVEVPDLSFNSLQTGKRIWTQNSEPKTQEVEQSVSIPFKRESVSEHSLGSDTFPNL